MRGKKLLVGLLVGVMIVCLVPVMGYGEIKQWMYEERVPYIKFFLLERRLDYFMMHRDTFLFIHLHDDPDGKMGEEEGFPEGVNTKGKIIVHIYDSRGVFSYKTGIALLDEFKKQLEIICEHIGNIVTDTDNDIVALFISGGGRSVGYFYQGEYHLWEE